VELENQQQKDTSKPALGAQEKKALKKPTKSVKDGRPETTAQRKLQDMANNSPQAMRSSSFHDMANNKNKPQDKQTAQLHAQKPSLPQATSFAKSSQSLEASKNQGLSTNRGTVQMVDGPFAEVDESIQKDNNLKINENIGEILQQLDLFVKLADEVLAAEGDAKAWSSKMVKFETTAMALNAAMITAGLAATGPGAVVAGGIFLAIGVGLATYDLYQKGQQKKLDGEVDAAATGALEGASSEGKAKGKMDAAKRTAGEAGLLDGAQQAGGIGTYVGNTASAAGSAAATGTQMGGAGLGILGLFLQAKDVRSQLKHKSMKPEVKQQLSALAKTYSNNLMTIRKNLTAKNWEKNRDKIEKLTKDVHGLIKRFAQ